MRSLEESRPQRQKVDGGSWGVVEGVHASWGQRLSLGRWEVLEMGGGVFAQWCECASCHGAVHLETVMMVNFMLCMLPQ